MESKSGIKTFTLNVNVPVSGLLGSGGQKTNVCQHHATNHSFAAVAFT